MKFLSSERLSQHKYKTPEGYLICVDAILARTGKQTYRKNEIFADAQDDSEVEVDRKAEEVFSPATLASFENKPITVEHPDEDVNAGNHNELSVGFVRDVHKGVAEGQDVMLGTLVITDAQTIAEIENGEHVELSCGYDCDIVDETNPQQRNIRGNHVALCQQGRAGIARIVDSVKDEDIFKVDVSSAEDRDVSRFITEAQNAGFTTEDKGYTIYLKNGNKEMLNKLKARTHTTAIKFVDSTKDIAPTKASGTDKIVYIMQSDADSNLYFYIGKTFSMKEGAWGYTKYEMGSTSPEQLKAELTRNGWHEVSNGPAKIIDAQSVMFKGENTFIFANKDMIPERTHYKGDVEYEGKHYYYHEGFDTKRKYLVPIVDSIKDAKNYKIYQKTPWGEVFIAEWEHNSKEEAVKEFLEFNPKYANRGVIIAKDSVKDDLVFGYTQKDLDLANNMLSKATTENEKKLIESLIAKIKYEMTNKEMRDSQKKYEVSYVEDSIEHIHVVRATSLKEAINKVKGGK